MRKSVLFVALLAFFMLSGTAIAADFIWQLNPYCDCIHMTFDPTYKILYGYNDGCGSEQVDTSGALNSGGWVMTMNYTQWGGSSLAFGILTGKGANAKLYRFYPDYTMMGGDPIDITLGPCVDWSGFSSAY